jgi:hypothetical protein
MNGSSTEIARESRATRIDMMRGPLDRHRLEAQGRAWRGPWTRRIADQPGHAYCRLAFVVGAQSPASQSVFVCSALAVAKY